jgi:hypothetical protein
MVGKRRGGREGKEGDGRRERERARELDGRGKEEA